MNKNPKRRICYERREMKREKTKNPYTQVNCRYCESRTYAFEHFIGRFVAEPCERKPHSRAAVTTIDMIEKVAAEGESLE